MTLNDNRRRQLVHADGLKARSGGYAMAALLVGLGVMSIASSAALAMWTTVAAREREAELVFRGEQYTRAIRLYQRRHAGSLPRSVEVLVEGRFLRRRYLDPVTNAPFVPLFAAAHPSACGCGGEVVRDPSEGYGGMVGVVSSSSSMSLGQYHGGKQYDQWLFVVNPSDIAVRRLHPPPGDEPAMPFGAGTAQGRHAGPLRHVPID